MPSLWQVVGFWAGLAVLALIENEINGSHVSILVLVGAFAAAGAVLILPYAAVMLALERRRRSSSGKGSH
jgi:hypothetical protein